MRRVPKLVWVPAYLVLFAVVSAVAIWQPGGPARAWTGAVAVMYFALWMIVLVVRDEIS